MACAQCHVGGKYAGTPRLRLLPPGQVPGHEEPEPRDRRLPDHLRDLPHHERLDARHLRPRQDRASRSPASTRPWPAPSATWAASTRARPTDCSPATRRSTRPPRTRTTRPPASPPPARPATPRTAGRPPPSTTARPRFPLTGKHQTVACAQCHVGGKYAGTPTDCYACHQAKYQATKNPNHVAAGFPTTCATLPHHERLDARDLRPRQDRASRSPASTRRWPAPVPRRRQVRGHADGLLRLPPGQVPGHQESEPRGRRVPDHLRDLPHDERLDAGHLQPHLVPDPASRRQGTCDSCHMTPSNYKAFECILCHEHSNKTKWTRSTRDERGTPT